MTEFYYSENPTTAHDEYHFDFTLLGKTLHFTSDSGVFSKNTVDYGSRALIEAVSILDLPDGPLLDVGCGYGPIGLALAAHFPERTVWMTDVNERALALAKRNAEANQIENVQIVASDGYAQVQGAFAAIFTNPPIRAGKKVVNRILTEAKPLLQENGSLTAVLQKKQGAPSAKKLMTEVYGNCAILSRDKGYYILNSRQKAAR